VLANNQLGKDAMGTFGGAAGRLPDDCFGSVPLWLINIETMLSPTSRFYAPIDSICGPIRWRLITPTYNTVCLIEHSLRWCHNLTSLDLSNNKHLQVLPSSLGHLTKLESLNASHCALTRVTTKVWGCSFLKRLELQVISGHLLSS
jgi:Leucine-rich repeat (LRR) protein